LYRKKPLTARREVAKLELSITLIIIYTYPIEQGGGMIMAGEIQADADALIMDIKDQVATALKDLAAGMQFSIVADGKLTKAEILGHQEFSINRIGPSL
jgi:hypothetical protein